MISLKQNLVAALLLALLPCPLNAQTGSIQENELLQRVKDFKDAATSSPLSDDADFAKNQIVATIFDSLKSDPNDLRFYESSLRQLSFLAAKDDRILSVIAEAQMKWELSCLAQLSISRADSDANTVMWSTGTGAVAHVALAMAPPHVVARYLAFMNNFIIQSRIAQANYFVPIASYLVGKGVQKLTTQPETGLCSKAPAEIVSRGIFAEHYKSLGEAEVEQADKEALKNLAIILPISVATTDGLAKLLQWRKAKSSACQADLSQLSPTIATHRDRTQRSVDFLKRVHNRMNRSWINPYQIASILFFNNLYGSLYDKIVPDQDSWDELEKSTKTFDRSPASSEGKELRAKLKNYFQSAEFDQSTPRDPQELALFYSLFEEFGSSEHIAGLAKRDDLMASKNPGLVALLSAAKLKNANHDDYEIALELAKLYYVGHINSVAKPAEGEGL